MNLREFFSNWLDVRPHELRRLSFSFLGAFLTVSNLVLARAIRESLYLTTFDVDTLPYVTGAAAILAVPAVEVFSRWLERRESRQVLRALLLIQIGGIGLLAPWLESSRVAVVLFYLWTALGALVLATGYWIVTSEMYSLRSAKRLFGIISAGGTLGAMAFGMSVGWLTHVLALPALALLLIALLFASFLLVERLTPAAAETAPETTETAPEAAADVAPSRWSGLRLLWENPHLRVLGLIVMAATLATTLLDYQFKEALRAEIPGREDLAGVLGAFYGWTGAGSFLIQLLFGGRALKRLGVGWTLSILPIVLFVGSFCFLFLPLRGIITAVRGADMCLRKSLHRAVLEVLFVPLSSRLRRRTKAFIDSVLDSVAAGMGAGIVFVWVTWADLPSIYLSVGILVVTGIFVALNHRMHAQYLQTLVRRLTEENTPVPQECTGPLLGSEVLTGTMEDLEIPSELLESGRRSTEAGGHDTTALQALERLESPDDRVALDALRTFHGWRPEYAPAVVRLLGRDALCAEASRVLATHGGVFLDELVRTLEDPQQIQTIRRRIPRILALLPVPAARSALLAALRAERFEIRYRAGLALWCRRDRGLDPTGEDFHETIWAAVRYELGQDRAIWELQSLLDRFEEDGDTVILQNVAGRGHLGLAHTFRLLAMVLDEEAVLIAFRGVQERSERLVSLSLEYLEHVLPADVRQKLWPFIGDLSEYERKKRSRPLTEVISELRENRSTLVFSESDSARLRRALGLDPA